VQNNTKVKNSDYELAAIAQLNSDLNRTDYAKVSNAPAKLAQVVGSAMQGHNPFQFCREVSRLARKLQRPSHSRIQETITAAMMMLSHPEKRPAGRSVTVGVAA
jgi:hypothetical protein